MKRIPAEVGAAKRLKRSDSFHTEALPPPSEGISITGEELLGKYRMTLESAVVFFSAYMDYITGITNQKN